MSPRCGETNGDMARQTWLYTRVVFDSRDLWSSEVVILKAWNVTFRLIIRSRELVMALVVVTEMQCGPEPNNGLAFTKQ